MGHYLDPLLDQVKARYSHDTQDAHQSGWEEGIEYVQRIIMNYAKTSGTDLISAESLLEFIQSNPSL